MFSKSFDMGTGSSGLKRKIVLQIMNEERPTVTMTKESTKESTQIESIDLPFFVNKNTTARDETFDPCCALLHIRTRDWHTAPAPSCLMFMKSFAKQRTLGMQVRIPTLFCRIKITAHVSWLQLRRLQENCVLLGFVHNTWRWYLLQKILASTQIVHEKQLLSHFC